jgi:hypothetical protein
MICKHLNCTNEATYGNQCQPCRNSISRYGITTPQKLTMLDLQDGRCMICRDEIEFNSTTKGANVDHCHKTGQVRGIVCSNCNTWIGYVENKSINLDKLISYLS